jgi:hypothetical protein
VPSGKRLGRRDALRTFNSASDQCIGAYQAILFDRIVA